MLLRMFYLHLIVKVGVSFMSRVGVKVYKYKFSDIVFLSWTSHLEIGQSLGMSLGKEFGKNSAFPAETTR